MGEYGTSFPVQFFFQHIKVKGLIIIFRDFLDFYYEVVKSKFLVRRSILTFSTCMRSYFGMVEFAQVLLVCSLGIYIQCNLFSVYTLVTIIC